MKTTFLLLISFILIIGCKAEPRKDNPVHYKNTQSLDLDTLKFTDGFDFPVGKPNAKNYYNAQKFGENNHLGEDWNGVGGGNTDLGEPVYAIANGYVSFAENVYGGWGNIIRIVHFIDNDNRVESLYAHCNEIYVKKGHYVNRGEKIGTIGTNSGQYLAHLHFEIRNKIALPLGHGYSSETEGYLNPTEFIKSNRNIE